MEDMKPCPFCGGGQNSHEDWCFILMCLVNEEQAMFGNRRLFTEEELNNAWNQRVERTCKTDDNGRCECGTLVRWKDNCEPYETADGRIAYKSIHPPITRYYDYCPHCGAKAVE